jgi:WD40 repeat protein
LSHSKILSVALVLSLTIQLHAQNAATSPVNLVKLDKTLSGHTKKIQEIAFSPRGEIVAASGGDGTVRLWNVATGDPLGTIAGQKNAEVSRLNWSGDERRLAIGYRIKKSWELVIYEISSTQPPVITHRFPVAQFLEWRADSRTFLALDQQWQLKIWDAFTGEAIHTLTPKVAPDKALTASFVANGELVLTASENGAVELWDVSTGKLIGTHAPNTEADGPIFLMLEIPVFSTDSLDKRFFISGDSEIYEAASRKLVTSVKDERPVSFSPDGTKLLTLRYDDFKKTRHRQNYLTLRTIADGKELQTFQVPEGISDIYWSPGGDKVAIEGLEFNTRIFDTATGRQSGRLPYGNCWPWQLCGSDDCESVTFSVDGAVLLKEKEPIKLWDSANVSLIKEFKGAHLPAIFSPAERLLAMRSEDKKSVLLWRF